jgi:poly-beta-1,6-N-acetyl-D-glucosamine synthase
MTRRLPTYVLITPARNEAALIEQTIQSVISQTERPARWVVVSDGSTDATDSIVEAYARAHEWIRLVKRPPGAERDFGAKVMAFNAAYPELAGIPYDVIGNLDADITFEPDYLEFLMGKFSDDPRLGVAGTPFLEAGRRGYDYRFTSIEHVSGACQLFRRECFEEIGGYVPAKRGGIDLVAVLKARMNGWRTRTFTAKSCQHHRRIGTAKESPCVAAFRGGCGDYALGSHPLWELSRCIYQTTRSPIVVGGLLRLVGFTWAMLTRVAKEVPPELVRFRRSEQMGRLRRFIGSGARVPDR